MKCVKAERNFAKEKCPQRFRDHVRTVSTLNCKVEQKIGNFMNLSQIQNLSKCSYNLY